MGGGCRVRVLRPRGSRLVRYASRRCVGGCFRGVSLGLVVTLTAAGLGVREVRAAPSAGGMSSLAPLPSASTSSGALDVPAGDFSNPPRSPSDGELRPRPRARHDVSKALVVRRGERSVTYRNPDGTLTERMFADPISFMDAAGTWQAIDPTLVDDGEGRYRNAAGPFDVRLSGSTDDPAIVRLAGKTWSIAVDAESKTMGRVAAKDKWSATYVDALPDADLHLSVGRDFVKQLVVLKRRPPVGRSASFRFRLSLSGLRAQAEDRGVVFYDDAGVEALIIPPGRMWDSNWDDGKGEFATAPVSITLDRAGGRSVLVVTADAGWLTDPARVYPVSIDPTYYPGVDSGRWDSFVTSSIPNGNFNVASNGNYYEDKVGFYDSGTGANRTFMKYDVSGLTGRNIFGAWWNGYFKHTYYVYQSTPYYLEPVSPPQWNDASITWNNQPGVCCGIINDTAVRNQWRTLDMTTWVANWTSGVWANNGIRVGANESNQTHWKKLAANENNDGSASYLEVDYNTLPPASSPALPMNGGDLMTTTPTLQSAPVSDLDAGQTISYWYRVATGADGETGSTVNSGWIPRQFMDDPGRVASGRRHLLLEGLHHRRHRHDGFSGRQFQDQSSPGCPAYESG